MSNNDDSHFTGTTKVMTKNVGRDVSSGDCRKLAEMVETGDRSRYEWRRPEKLDRQPCTTDRQ